MPSFILSDNFTPWLLLNVPPHCLLLHYELNEVPQNQNSPSVLWIIASKSRIQQELTSSFSFFHRPSGLLSKSATSDTLTLV